MKPMLRSYVEKSDESARRKSEFSSMKRVGKKEGKEAQKWERNSGRLARVD